jgi:hypothetical protein
MNQKSVFSSQNCLTNSTLQTSGQQIVKRKEQFFLTSPTHTETTDTETETETETDTAPSPI